MRRLLRVQLVHKTMDRLDDRIERALVTRKKHPACKRPATLAIEGVERQIDNLSGRTHPGPRRARCIADRFADRRGQMRGERFLQLGRRAEVVQEVGMRTADTGGDGLECYRLGPSLQQEGPCGLHCRSATLLGRQSLSY